MEPVDHFEGVGGEAQAVLQFFCGSPQQLSKSTFQGLQIGEGSQPGTHVERGFIFGEGRVLEPLSYSLAGDSQPKDPDIAFEIP